jgi:uncharacterized protein
MQESGGGVTISSLHSSRPRQISSTRRIVYLAGAGLCFGSGILGVLLPGLPATPFLLMTSYLLAQSWPRLNDSLLRLRVLGPILRDWQQHRGIRPDVKLRAIVTVVLLVSATSYFSPLNRPLMVLVAGLATIGVLLILRLPSVRES